jgi:hypothetical protein
MIMLSIKKVRRLQRGAGFALGPILFIVAILVILGAVIAAGRGAFNASSNTQNTESRASAII